RAGAGHDRREPTEAAPPLADDQCPRARGFPAQSTSRWDGPFGGRQRQQQPRVPTLGGEQRLPRLPEGLYRGLCEALGGRRRRLAIDMAESERREREVAPLISVEAIGETLAPPPL